LVKIMLAVLIVKTASMAQHDVSIIQQNQLRWVGIAAPVTIGKNDSPADAAITIKLAARPLSAPPSSSSATSIAPGKSGAKAKPTNAVGATTPAHHPRPSICISVGLADIPAKTDIAAMPANK